MLRARQLDGSVSYMPTTNNETPNVYIPKTPALRAEQVLSWAFQAADWNYNPKSTIESHYSANAVLNSVEDNEKLLILEAWAKGYKQGTRPSPRA